jgi:hypothetical protein
VEKGKGQDYLLAIALLLKNLKRRKAAHSPPMSNHSMGGKGNPPAGGRYCILVLSPPGVRKTWKNISFLEFFLYFNYNKIFGLSNVEDF